MGSDNDAPMAVDGRLATLLLNSTGEGIYGVNMAGDCTFANPACLQILGFDGIDELLGVHMHDLVHHTRPNGEPYDVEECQIYRAFMNNEGVHVDDEIMFRKDGTSFLAEYWSYPVEEDGQLVGCVLTFTDITQRRRAERKLRESEQRTRLLLNSTGEGIYGVDLRGNCTFANPACLKLLGFDEDADLLGRNMHDLVHHTLPNGDIYLMKECRIYKAFREGKGVHCDDEVMWREDGSSFPAEYWSYPMEIDGRIIGSVLTFIDITARRRLESKLRREHARAERLLLNVLPAAIAEQLKAHPGKTIADAIDEVTVLFADVVGFTPLSARLTPKESVELLNEVFTAFDRFAVRYDVEKIRTIGDGYMCAAGAPERREDHCQAIARMALDMRDWMKDMALRDSLPLQLRIGINTGAAVGAVIGTTKFHYDLWGDTINVAARMESLGQPGRIQVGASTYEILQEDFILEARGEIEVKGKGRMHTWFLEGFGTTRLDGELGFDE